MPEQKVERTLHVEVSDSGTVVFSIDVPPTTVSECVCPSIVNCDDMLSALLSAQLFIINYKRSFNSMGALESLTLHKKSIWQEFKRAWNWMFDSTVEE